MCMCNYLYKGVLGLGKFSELIKLKLKLLVDEPISL